MSAGLLVSAAGAAYAKGLRHVYVGNADHQIGELSHTRCPDCHTVVVERRGYEASIPPGHDASRCPECARPIAGVWA